MHLGSHIIVLADDLSGAAELVGIAYAQGLTAEVQRGFDPASSAELVAVDSDTRGLSERAAAERVRDLAEQIVARRPAWIYKKTDSVLRGHPGAEIEAILDVTGQDRAVFVPANPSRGRVIVKGQYLIDGVLLDQTAFADDPEYPRKTAEVGRLLGGDENRVRRICMPDVTSGDELSQLAQGLDEKTLAAGAADFFTALLEARRGSRRPSNEAAVVSIPGPALLVCGSRAAWLEREAECHRAGLPIRTLSDRGPVEQAMQQFLASGALVLAIGNDAQGGVANPLGRLVEQAEAVLRGGHVGTLLAEGGATAEAIAERLGWRRFAVCGVAPAGVGVLQPMAGEFAPRMLIKPGSYAWPSEIWESMRRCAPTPTRSRKERA